MSIELKDPRLLARVERLAVDRTQPAERIVEMAVQLYLDTLDADAIHAETEAFWAMHAELVTQYVDQHVAIYDSEVVDHDPDARRLEARIRERFGAAPVLIARVTLQARRDLRWRGGRLEKLGATL
jgi:hypothetical protein